jgi:transcriptional regulator with XRE-family HTH domain
MGTSKNAVGRRLAAFHAAEGITQAEVCRAIGIKENRYSQYLSGSRKLPVEVAVKLKATYGLTTDWLYANDVSTLPAKLHNKLAQVAAA